jgi:enterochelin esterase family protein
MSRFLRISFLIGLIAVAAPAVAQSPAAQPPASAAPVARSANPTRDPLGPGFVTAKELPDGSVPPANADGNVIIGPTHTRAPV